MFGHGGHEKVPVHEPAVAAPSPMAPGPPGYGAGGGMKLPTLTPLSPIWFGAAFCTMLGAIISCVAFVSSLQWIDALEMAYLFFFGMLLSMVDTPFCTNATIVRDIRIGLGRYVAAVLRCTGKGVAYIFLGVTLWASMWENLESKVLLFLAVIMGSIIFLVGLASVVIGIIKSRSLNLVRVELKKDGSLGAQHMYEKHAFSSPQYGMTPEEFKRMTADARGVHFETADLKMVFNALSSYPDRSVLTQNDVTLWVNGGMVFI